VIRRGDDHSVDGLSPISFVKLPAQLGSTPPATPAPACGCVAPLFQMSQTAITRGVLAAEFNALLEELSAAATRPIIPIRIKRGAERTSRPAMAPENYDSSWKNDHNPVQYRSVKPGGGLGMAIRFSRSSGMRSWRLMLWRLWHLAIVATARTDPLREPSFRRSVNCAGKFPHASRSIGRNHAWRGYLPYSTTTDSLPDIFFTNDALPSMEKNSKVSQPALSE
jgi:hypothetical protein